MPRRRVRIIGALFATTVFVSSASQATGQVVSCSAIVGEPVQSSAEVTRDDLGTECVAAPVNVHDTLSRNLQLNDLVKEALTRLDSVCRSTTVTLPTGEPGVCGPAEAISPSVDPSCAQAVSEAERFPLVRYGEQGWEFIEPFPLGVTLTPELEATTTGTDELIGFLNDRRSEREKNADHQSFLKERTFILPAAKLGTTAFGSRGSECPIQTHVEADWPVNTQLLVRRVVDFPARPGRPSMQSMQIFWAMDNDLVDLFFDGRRVVRDMVHGGCPVNLPEDNQTVMVGGVAPGPHLVSFHLVDRGVESFFDARIDAVFEARVEGLKFSAVGDVRIQCSAPGPRP